MTDTIEKSVGRNKRDEGRFTVYHYTDFLNWHNIKSGALNSYNPGLAACRRVGRVYEPAKSVLGVWALDSQDPPTWVENNDFPHIWNELRRVTGNLLLEVDVDKDDDGVFVLDWAHREGEVIMRDLEKNPNATFDYPIPPSRYQHESRLSSEIAYWEGRVTLREYMDRRKSLCFSLPEVVITHQVPLDRIRISEYQKRFISELQNAKQDNFLLDFVRCYPEIVRVIDSQSGVLKR